MLKFGLKTAYATCIKGARSNLGSLPVWTGNGPISRLILPKIVQIWTVSPKTLKFGLKTPYATLIKRFGSNLDSFSVWTRNWPKSCLILRKIVQIWIVSPKKLKIGLNTPYATPISQIGQIWVRFQFGQEMDLLSVWFHAKFFIIATCN